jgi:hypothetical protein
MVGEIIPEWRAPSSQNRGDFTPESAAHPDAALLHR